MPFGRLPNGLGTITKLRRNLRNPYRAQKLVGEEFDEINLRVRRIYRTVGYYHTRKEALEALIADGGISAAGEIVTLKNIYDAWSAKKYETLTRSSIKNYKYAIAAFTPLLDKRFSDLRPVDYESCITDETPDTRLYSCKVLLNQLYAYAMRYELCEKDYSSSVDFGKRNHAAKERRIFTPEEVKMLWQKSGDTFVDMILVLLFTGFRVNEMLSLTTASIRDGCLIGGMKTENGRNRVVPIHPMIFPIIERFARKSANFGEIRLFCGDDGREITYEAMRARFGRICPNHILHETRHSFATYARMSGMDLVATKRILGHSIRDVTEGTYTHLDVNALKAEMAKYKIE